MSFQSRCTPTTNREDSAVIFHRARFDLVVKAVICFCEKNRRALYHKPSNLSAWGVHDEQLGNVDLHRAAQTQLPGKDIARRAPSFYRNKVRGLNAKRPLRHKHQLACLESMVQL
jgi:hypothetical protein